MPKLSKIAPFILLFVFVNSCILIERPTFKKFCWNSEIILDFSIHDASGENENNLHKEELKEDYQDFILKEFLKYKPSSILNLTRITNQLNYKNSIIEQFTPPPENIYSVLS